MGLLTNISLFSGVGGLDIGAKIVGGIRTVCYVERDAFAQSVLMSRIRDSGLDDAPIWNDVTTFDGKPWRGIVDIISGGFPCQDVSMAGRREGIKVGNRSGLWHEYARIIREVGPACVLVENVAGLILDGGIGTVLGSLADSGYDAFWFVLPASRVGAPHSRDRCWIVAYPIGAVGLDHQSIVEDVCVEVEKVRKEIGRPYWGKPELGHWTDLSPSQLQTVSSCDQPPLLRMDDVVAEELDEISHRLKACGNGVCGVQAAPAWRIVKKIAWQICGMSDAISTAPVVNP